MKFNRKLIMNRVVLDCILIVTVLFMLCVPSYLVAAEPSNLDAAVFEWTERDEPVQLVKPDAKHKKLVVIEENLRLLQRIPGSVATVAVVGKFHSGKSFLMNQLMKKSTGFGIGPTVKPETMGIWMWGKPLTIKTKSGGKPLSVIFLDTEGFAANNISELYDAKIFAVATLLSSYLLYNSVKIIDQSDIDYLEILARRTQLFALRSQLSKAEWTQDFNRDLLSFPPLLWVVQDFVQSTEGFTPTEWLQQLMDTHTRENEDYEISLLGIFNKIDCHTLFIPATKKHLLIDLSRAQEDDLTEDYKLERDKLVDTLFSNLKPKEKNEKPITGVELANLLRILVTAANEGSLSDVPTRWVAFTQHLQTTATEDCLKFYEAELNQFLTKDENEPAIPQKFQEWHKQASNKSINLLGHLLFGLSDATEKSKSELVILVAQKFEKAFDVNDKRIKLKCSELHSRLLLDAEMKYGEISLPISSQELNRVLVSVTSEIIQSFLKSVKHLLIPEVIEKYLINLKTSLKNLGDSIQLKNNKAVEAFLNSGTTQAISKFKQMLENEGNDPRLPRVLDSLIRSSTSHSLNFFNEFSKQFSEESVYLPFASQLKENLSEEAKQFHNENEDLVKIFGSKVINGILTAAEEQTSAAQISLPVQNSELESKLNAIILLAGSKFKEALDEFQTYQAHLHLKTAMVKGLDVLAARRRKENVEAFTKEVAGPLKAAKSVILLSVENFSTQFSLKQYMRKVCLINLNEGRASAWPFELRMQIIEHFFQTDVQLKEILKLKQGWWSNFVGFFQWILWVIGFNDEK